MKNLILLILFLLAFGAFEVSATSSAPKLQKFETDYCTMFVDGTKDKPEAFKQCCFDHDLRFWFGGSEVQRDLADSKLKECVEKTGHTLIAKMMYYAVRAGKHSPIKNQYQWGWGWTPFEGYKPLSKDQKKVVSDSLDGMSLESDYLKEFKAYYGL